MGYWESDRGRYNPDGSRAEVSRSDTWTGEVNQFVWNPEGTLARWWNTEPNRYARVFSYDEEGRLTKIERDYGNGNLQTAYEYGYNSDGVKVLERRYRTAQHWLKFRFIGCGVGCVGNSLSLYAREHFNGQNLVWLRAEEYVNAPTALMYGIPTNANAPVAFVMYPVANGYVVHSADGQMVAPYYTDSGGVPVGGYALPACAEKRDWEAGCVPYPVVPNPEMPPAVYLPPYESPNTNLGDYESPLPGPWDDFKEAIGCSVDTLNADEICRPPLEYYDEYMKWCMNHPYCVGNELCCHQRCIEYITGHRWDEFAWRWIEFDEDVIERVPKRCAKRAL